MGFIIFLIIILAILFRFVKVVNQSQSFVIERLGSYKETWNTGLHFLVPFIDRIAKRISLKEQVMDFPPQPVITKDNVTMQIDTVVYSQITDPKLATYGIEDPIKALENLTATTLRNIIGELDLDETLTSRDVINTKMRSILDEATDRWGIKVNRVEVKNIQPPKDIQNAMEKQMRAERERRAKILEAEGNKKSAILEAEGRKEAQILEAEANRESAIHLAEGNKQSEILEAQGRAEAIRQVQQATAEGLSAISEANISDETLRIRALEAVKDLANGKATKLVVPSELQDLTVLGNILQTSFKDQDKK